MLLKFTVGLSWCLASHAWLFAAPVRRPLRLHALLDDELMKGPAGEPYLIKLDQFLKFVDAGNSGGHIKALVAEGEVAVNGVTETRRGRKLREGDLVLVNGGTFDVAKLVQPKQAKVSPKRAPLATRTPLKKAAAPPKAAAAATDPPAAKAKKVLAKVLPSSPRVQPDDFYGNAEEEEDDGDDVIAVPKKAAKSKKTAPAKAAKVGAEDEEDWGGDVALDAELEALIAADLKANLGDLGGGGGDDSDYDDYELGVEDGDLLEAIDDDGGDGLEAPAEAGPAAVAAPVRLAALEGRWTSLYTDQASGAVSETAWQIAASGVAVYRAVAPGSHAAAAHDDAASGWSAPAPETNVHENEERVVQRGDGWALDATSTADRLLWRLPGDAHDGLVWTRAGEAPPAELAAAAAALAAVTAAKTRAAPGVVAKGETKGGVSLTMRRAKPSDLKKIGAMAWAPETLPSGGLNTPAEAAQWVVAELARGFGGAVAVARAGPPPGSSAGSAGAAVVELTSLAVAPSARQRGVAGAVVDYVVATSAPAAGEVVARLPGYKNKAAKKAVKSMFDARGVRVLENF